MEAFFEGFEKQAGIGNFVKGLFGKNKKATLGKDLKSPTAQTKIVAKGDKAFRQEAPKPAAPAKPKKTFEDGHMGEYWNLPLNTQPTWKTRMAATAR